jgi:hypothetical protein
VPTFNSIAPAVSTASSLRRSFLGGGSPRPTRTGIVNQTRNVLFFDYISRTRRDISVKFSPDVARRDVTSCAELDWNISSRFGSIVAAPFVFGWRLYQSDPHRSKHEPYLALPISDERVEASVRNFQDLCTSVWPTGLPSLVAVTLTVGTSFELCHRVRGCDSQHRPNVDTPGPRSTLILCDTVEYRHAVCTGVFSDEARVERCTTCLGGSGVEIVTAGRSSRVSALWRSGHFFEQPECEIRTRHGSKVKLSVIVCTQTGNTHAKYGVDISIGSSDMVHGRFGPVRVGLRRAATQKRTAQRGCCRNGQSYSNATRHSCRQDRGLCLAKIS